MKLNTQVLTVTALTLILSSVSFASDLKKDLKAPFDVMTNPFENVKEVSLTGPTAQALKNLVEQCTFRIVTKTENGEAWGEAQLDSECADRATLKKVDGPMGGWSKLVIHDKGLELLAVIWDGSYSDGGDEQALGIYDRQGDRIAVYPNLYADGNVIDALAMAAGTDVPQLSKIESNSK